MAADFQNVTIVNIYAPSGAERRRDRENVFRTNSHTTAGHPTIAPGWR